MNKKYLIIGLILTTISLQSCFVAKKYQKPDFQIQDQYRNISTSDSASLASLAWDELFSDNKLKVLIKDALGSNLDLLMAVERVSAAEAYYKQGKSGNLPSLTIGANAGNYDLSDNSLSAVSSGGKGASYENYQLNANISWEADIWGKIRSNKRATQASYFQSEASKRAIESRLVANIASAYYQLVALDSQLAVAEKAVSNRKESLETMKNLKEAGMVTQAAVKQTEAQLYSTQILQIDLKQNVALLENTISLLLGQNPDIIDRNTLEDQNMNVDLNTGYPTQLLRNRPDVMAAEYELINAFELTNVAKSKFYPSISISANAGLEAIDFSNWFNSASIFSNVIGNLAQPLFNKRSIKTKYEVAKARQAESQYNFEKVILSSAKEVSDAMYSYQSEQEKFKIREKEVKALNEAASYAEELLVNAYQNTTYLEVLTAQNNALSSEIKMIDSKFKQLNSIVDLYLALGGGWVKN